MLPRFYRPEAEIRKHQINTLKIFNDNVTEITENYDYEISFTSERNEFNLQVSLGADFPKEKPLLKINPLIIHPWVNTEGVITSAPGLINFTVHSDLGRVVQAIIREFQRNPPPLVINNNVKSPTIPILDGEKRTSPVFPTNFSNFSPPSNINTASFVHQSVTFPELNNLSLEELQFLNENEDRQQEFVDELLYIKEQNKMLDELISQVEELAESNLGRQEQLRELKNGIDLRIEEVTKLAFENERLHVKYNNLSDKYSPKNIQEQLCLAAEKADKESEKVAEAFLQGELDVEKFLLQFIKTKTLCQMRKTKEEKLSHQLDSLERAGF